MFINNFDPVAFSLYIFDIRWYSLSYIFGILFGWFYINKFFLKENNLKQLFDNYITYIIIGIILGGRIGYILFYNLRYYLSNPLDIFLIWEGGMSFHGGLIGVIFLSIIFARKNEINVFKFLDLVASSAPIGIFLGRVSNFINSELYGRQTDLPWAVKFLKIDNLNRHPSQIYEAIFEGIILFLILNFYKKKLINPGFISSLFLMIYSFFRFFIEFTREPDIHLGLIIYQLSMGQIISLITLAFGILLFYLKFKNETKKVINSR